MARVVTICRCCVSDGVPRRSFIVALIVGVTLNLINQGDALFGGGQLNFTKLILTFAVPYCVATYGAVSFRLSTSRSGESEDGARLSDCKESNFLRTTKGGK